MEKKKQHQQIVKNKKKKKQKVSSMVDFDTDFDDFLIEDETTAMINIKKGIGEIL
jgi:hypothetical protein